MFGEPCLCDGRKNIRCTKTRCSIAGPGGPGDADECRVCWNRLGRPRPKRRRRGPGIFRKAVNYAGASYQHWRAGKPKVGPMTKRFRLALCEGCTQWFDRETRHCKHVECGCPMDCKSGWAEQKCPIGRWPAVEDEMDGEYLTVADFFGGAEEMRRQFEEHFGDPGKHGPAHQVWNYWHVPDQYCYLRTSADRLFHDDADDSDPIARFLTRLNEWAKPLGVQAPATPWLSVYINGMGQGLHNDAAGGKYGYVFSLTRWDQRCFTGGETIIFPTEPYWGTDRVKFPQAGASLYHRVPAQFNQLLIFDDRLIHGVERVQGTMDPLAGRVVLHGHLDTL